MRPVLRLLTTLLLVPLAVMQAADREPTSAEIELKRQLGPDTPDAIPLWPGEPPRFLEGAPAETVVENARIRECALPTLTP